MDRDALGDAHDEDHPCLCRLINGVGGEPGGDEDQGGVRLLSNRVADRVEHRDALHVLARLSGGDPGDDVGAVGAVAKRVEGTLPAGDPLNDDPR